MSILAQLEAGVETRSAPESQALAGALAAELPREAVLALHGDLGVGKTTFVQGLARALGVAEAVTSPTFNLFTLHRGRDRLLVHFDAYRLDGAHQMDALMLEDFLTPPYCLAVEWPDNIAGWLPPGTLHLELSIVEPGRHRIVARRP